VVIGGVAALDQRIGLRYTMSHMRESENGSYLRHHLKLAGREDTLFSDDCRSRNSPGLRGCPSRNSPPAVT
jgi:type II secretory pathway predicted ATPase ExeA